MATRWWWIRHAPVPDDGHIYGQRDLDCDCSDRRVFEAIAQELPSGAVWIATNLVRTKQTAAAIRAIRPELCERDPLVVAALAEQHLGDWQGLHRQTFLAERRTNENPFWFGPAHERAPNGESFVDLYERVGAAIEELNARHAGRDIVAVAHGGTIRAALAHAQKLPPAGALSYVIDNCSLTCMDRLESGHWRIGAVNHRPWNGVRG